MVLVLLVANTKPFPSHLSKIFRIKKQYINSYYCRWPTLNKFDRLLESKDNKTVLRLSKFIFFANQLRTQLENDQNV